MNQAATTGAELLARLEALNRSLMAGVVKPLQFDRQLDGPDIVRALTASLAQNTERWADIQRRYYHKQLELLGNYAVTPAGTPAPPAAAAPSQDRRFAAPEWHSQP